MEGKSQNVRLLDVFVLGPFMVWAAMHPKVLPGWARIALAVSGVATIQYNWENYKRIRQTPR
jgi:hypothetical protein